MYKGKLAGLGGEGTSAIVAIKSLNQNASNKTQEDFKQEARLLSELHHPNIVCLVGVSFQEKPMFLLFEFMTQVTKIL